jgi:hypothetical protein
VSRAGPFELLEAKQPRPGRATDHALEAIKIEGATALRPLRPLSIVPLSFLGSRLNLPQRIKPPLFPGKRILQIQLWKAVHACAKNGEPFSVEPGTQQKGTPRRQNAKG